jgi:hypothetical protein
VCATLKQAVVSGIDSGTSEYILVLSFWVLTNRCDVVHVGSRRILLPEGVVSILGQSVWNVLSIVALGHISVRVLPLSLVTTPPPVLHAHKILCHRRFIIPANDGVVK